MDMISYLLGKKSSGSSGLDWQAIGYDSTPHSIINGYNYAKEIYDNWVPQTDLNNKFKYDKNLVIMPLVDTANTTTIYQMFSSCYGLIEVPKLDVSKCNSLYQMFYRCYALKSVPIFDTSNITAINGLSEMFTDCPGLSNESLDNILQMCINATSLTGVTKTLSMVGIQRSYYPASRIQALPHYQDFLDAGWTIGY